MKPSPPHHVVLPVLTERLPSTDDLIEEREEAVFEAQPSAYAQAVYRGAEYEQTEDVQAAALQPTMTLDERWQHLRPALRQDVLALVKAELDALAPQLTDRLLDALEPTLRASMAARDDEPT
ncbi:hypothetical protein [Thiomonas bhubaneswarensis]|uniref:Uncharacterized protein n=1 Tax=Thiomonas bhubaneswarensis TaxID=339866 RepID=A0A0K6HQI9_9BURK|nr:hypothetical protein [Thiomonas bhubaneswarensis]CUA93129.1 hypothetical protein Ga0061069_101114 [Thiomonas bhubaneswarensis]